jgi:mitogen-activated protein kinase kinase kinase 7
MAPEVVLKNEYTEKSDIYSFGIILWQLLTRREPFPHINSRQEMYR